MEKGKTVLILGANSDVAKAAWKRYEEKGDYVIAASRNTESLKAFAHDKKLQNHQICHFDAVNFESHQHFYENLPAKPQIILYAAGFLVQNEKAFSDFPSTLQMIQVHYSGAVSILNICISDSKNNKLEQIVGLSSLSGVRGRKSNFIYGSSKAAFSQYLTGLRQWLAPRKIKVNVVVAGYIRSKMTAGLPLNESLMLEPDFIAKAVVNAGRKKVIVPGWKWKIIYRILQILPEFLVARLP